MPVPGFDLKSPGSLLIGFRIEPRSLQILRGKIAGSHLHQSVAQLILVFGLGLQ